MILYNRADVGEYVGESKQQINEWYKRGQMPEPFAYMYKGAPLWTQEQMDEFYDNMHLFVVDRRFKK